MRRLILLYLLLNTLYDVSFAQLTFNKLYDFNLPTNHFRKLVVDNDTIIAYAMAFADSGSSEQGLLLAKIDSLGNVHYWRLLQDSSNAILSVDFDWGQIVSTPNGYVFTAVNLSQGYGWLVEIGKDLETKRIYEFADTIDRVEYYDSPIQLQNGYLISGRVQRQNYRSDGFVRRIDKSGNTLWFKYYGEYEKDEGIYSMVQLSENRFILGGSVGPDFNNSQTARAGLWVIDTNGKVIKTWIASDEPDFIAIRTLLPSLDGGLIAHGRTYVGQGQWGSRVQETLLKFDSSLQIEWVRQVGPTTSNYNSFWDMAATPDGNYVAVGRRTPYGDPTEGDDWGGWMFKFSPQGDSLWSRVDHTPPPLNTTIEEHSYGGVGALSSGNVVAGGMAIVNNKYYGWVVKVTTDGCLDTIFCNTVPTLEPPLVKDDLLKVWPNPADGEIQLKMPPNVFSGAAVILFNLQGQVVLRQTLAENQVVATLRTATLPNGAYFIEVRSEQGAVARKKIVVAH